MNNDPPPPVFDAAARTKLSHARNAVLHCKASWKELKASLGRNIVDTIDSSQSAELFQKLAESIDHMERTYEEVKKDQFLRPIAVDVRRQRPPHAQPKIAKERSNFFGSTLGNLLSHYEGKFRRGKQRDPEANAMEKKMKKMEERREEEEDKKKEKELLNSFFRRERERSIIKKNNNNKKYDSTTAYYN